MHNLPTTPASASSTNSEDGHQSATDNLPTTPASASSTNSEDGHQSATDNLPTTPASGSSINSEDGHQSATDNLPTKPASGSSTLGKAYSLVAISVGVALVATAILIVKFQIELPVSLLLTYCGVAALFSGLGATAAVSLNLTTAGQAGSATGAAAIAILLCWAIGPNPPPRPQKLTTTYYVQFPGIAVTSADLAASIEVEEAGKTQIQQANVARAPGGAYFEITARDVGVNTKLVIKVRSNKFNKSWSSASIRPTEGIMLLEEDHPQ
jgi:hypothetical protein